MNRKLHRDTKLCLYFYPDNIFFFSVSEKCFHCNELMGQQKFGKNSNNKLLRNRRIHPKSNKGPASRGLLHGYMTRVLLPAWFYLHVVLPRGYMTRVLLPAWFYPHVVLPHGYMTVFFSRRGFILTWFSRLVVQ